MLPTALNQMTVPDAQITDVLALAAMLGCDGVELRNDLGRPLFDGMAPLDVKDLATAHELKIHAVAEVKAFNDVANFDFAATQQLITSAAAAGACAVALIPHVGTAQVARTEQRRSLRQALKALMPVLADHDMTGLIEPIGFATSSLRHKADVAEAIAELDEPGRFAMIHDTFHHHLSGDADFHPELTAIVHISGVTDTSDALTDAHRGLIDASDRLDNIGQLHALMAAGYAGPMSLECFAPTVHQLTDPASHVARSFEFIATHMTAEAA